MPKTSKHATFTWIGRGRGFMTAFATIITVPLMKAVFAAAQATTTGSTSGNMDNMLEDTLNATRTENRHRRLYHVDVTETGEPCWENPLLDRVIDPANYEFGCRDIEYMLTGDKSLIGSGSVRDVWLVEYKGRTVVVKTLKDMETRRHRGMHWREAATMDALRGQRNVIGMLGLCETTVVTEYFSTKLLQYIFRHGRELPIHQIVSMSLDAVIGLQALHEVAGCLHIDLKPMQLLVDEEGRVKLNDFNSVHVLGINPSTGDFCPAQASKRHRREPWPSPENYAGEPLTVKADIYSMGMVLYSLLAGRRPFEDQESLEIALSNGGRPEMDSSWHRGMVEVIEDMWREDPKKRPSARQVVARLKKIQANLGNPPGSFIASR